MPILMAVANEVYWQKFENIHWFACETYGSIDNVLSNILQYWQDSQPDFDFMFWFLRVATMVPDDLVRDQSWTLCAANYISQTGYMQYSPVSTVYGKISQTRKMQLATNTFVIPQDPEKNILSRPTQAQIFNTLIENFLSAFPEQVGQALWDIGVTTKSPPLLGLGAVMHHAPQIYRFLMDLLGKIFAGGGAVAQGGSKPNVEGVDLVFHLAAEPAPDTFELKINSRGLMLFLKMQTEIRAWCKSMRTPLGPGGSQFLDGQLDQFVALLQGLNSAYKFYGLRTDPNVTDLLDLFTWDNPQHAAQIVQTNPLIQSIIDATCFQLNEQIDKQIQTVINQTTVVNEFDFDVLGTLLDGYFMRPGPAGGRQDNLWEATDHAVNLKIVARNADVTDWLD